MNNHPEFFSSLAGRQAAAGAAAEPTSWRRVNNGEFSTGKTAIRRQRKRSPRGKRESVSVRRWQRLDGRTADSPADRGRGCV